MANPLDGGSAQPAAEGAGRGAYVSFALVLVTVAAAVRDPGILGSNGTILDRLFGALLAVGAVGSALNGFRWRGNGLLRVIGNPSFAWPAIVVGIAYGIVS
jgi:hypothetical protein